MKNSKPLTSSLLQIVFFSSLAFGFNACGSKDHGSDTKDTSFASASAGNGQSAVSCNYNGKTGNTKEQCDALKAQSGGGLSSPIAGNQPQNPTTSSGLSVQVSCQSNQFVAQVKEGFSSSTLNLGNTCHPVISCNGSLLKASFNGSSSSVGLSSPAACLEAQKQILAAKY